MAPSSSGLGRRPLKAVTPVRIRSGLRMWQLVKGLITLEVVRPFRVAGQESPLRPLCAVAQPELGAPAFGHHVAVVRVLADPGADEGAVGKRPETGVARGVEGLAHEPGADAVATEARVHLGVHERDVIAPKAVVEESGEFLAVIDLKALPLGSVDDPQCHVVPTPSSRAGAALMRRPRSFADVRFPASAAHGRIRAADLRIRATRRWLVFPGRTGEDRRLRHTRLLLQVPVFAPYGYVRGESA